eukprot:1157755-Pelagomonas_calceolata.AAC.2
MTCGGDPPCWSPQAPGPERAWLHRSPRLGHTNEGTPIRVPDPGILFQQGVTRILTLVATHLVNVLRLQALSVPGFIGVPNPVPAAVRAHITGHVTRPVQRLLFCPTSI